MPTCCAFGCTNRRSKKVPGVSFHRFPRNVELREQWIKSIRRKNFTPSEHSVVCSEHFEETAFDRTSCLVLRLKHDALPTVFKGLPTYLQKRPTRFPCPKKQGRKKKLAGDALQRATDFPCHKKQGRKKELADDVQKAKDLPKKKQRKKEEKKAKKQRRTKELADDVLRDKCVERNLSAEELKESQPSESCPTEEGSTMSEKPTEYILPEREPYHSTNESSTNYLHPKIEPLALIESSRETASDLLISNKSCVKPRNLTVETSVISSRTYNESERLWNSNYLRSIVGNDHIYSNTSSPTMLKLKLDLICDHLNDVNKKLEIEEEKYRQAEKTIARLKKIIQKLQK